MSMSAAPRVPVSYPCGLIPEGPKGIAARGRTLQGRARVSPGCRRRSFIVNDERQSLQPEDLRAQRVTAASGHLPRCHSSPMGEHRGRRGVSHLARWRS